MAQNIGDQSAMEILTKAYPHRQLNQFGGLAQESYKFLFYSAPRFGPPFMALEVIHLYTVKYVVS